MARIRADSDAGERKRYRLRRGPNALFQSITAGVLMAAVCAQAWASFNPDSFFDFLFFCAFVGVLGVPASISLIVVVLAVFRGRYRSGGLALRHTGWSLLGPVLGVLLLRTAANSGVSDQVMFLGAGLEIAAFLIALTPLAWALVLDLRSYFLSGPGEKIGVPAQADPSADPAPHDQQQT